MKKIVSSFCFCLFLNLSFAQSAAPKVVALIEQTEARMGGQKTFDNIKHISWNFFGQRTLTWNKHTSDVRIDFHKENSVFLYNSELKTGRVLKDGIEVSQTDSLDKYLKQAHEIWINDTYWLVMPFKLDDPGVTTSYVGEKTTADGEDANVLQLTFNEVGVTPDNKYLVYIDKVTGLVSQWDFFTNNSDEEPRFSTPWKDYKTYGNVKLSGDRGQNKITDIHVFKKLASSVYRDFKRPSFIQ